MSLRDTLLPVLDSLRQLPAAFGLRRYSVTLRTRVWSGALPGEGTPTDVDVVISPPPRVRVVNTQEIASSGGTYRQGDFKVDKITPAFTVPVAGGHAPASLNIRPDADPKDVAVILVGDEGTLECEVVELHFDRAFNYWLVVRQIRDGVRG